MTTHGFIVDIHWL